MGFDLNTTINRLSTQLQQQGKYTPRRLNWHVWKAVVRNQGGHGYDSIYWTNQLATSQQRGYHWDNSHNLYKNMIVNEPSKSIFSKVGSIVKGATVGLVTTGNPAGALIGGGSGLFKSGGGVEPPPLLPVEPIPTQTQLGAPLLAGFQIPNKKSNQ